MDGQWTRGVLSKSLMVCVAFLREMWRTTCSVLGSRRSIVARVVPSQCAQDNRMHWGPIGMSWGPQKGAPRVGPGSTGRSVPGHRPLDLDRREYCGKSHRQYWRNGRCPNNAYLIDNYRLISIIFSRVKLNPKKKRKNKLWPRIFSVAHIFFICCVPRTFEGSFCHQISSSSFILSPYAFMPMSYEVHCSL